MRRKENSIYWAHGTLIVQVLSPLNCPHYLYLLECRPWADVASPWPHILKTGLQSSALSYSVPQACSVALVISSSRTVRCPDPHSVVRLAPLPLPCVPPSFSYWTSSIWGTGTLLEALSHPVSGQGEVLSKHLLNQWRSKVVLGTAPCDFSYIFSFLFEYVISTLLAHLEGCKWTKDLGNLSGWNALL